MTVTFAGDGPLAGAVRSRLKTLGLGAFSVGHVPNVPEVFATAGLLVSASTAEGLPMAVLEGAASGARLVLSDIEPHRVIASALGQPAHRLFAVGDSEALSQQLLATIGDRYDGRQSAAAARRIFDASVVARTYDEEFDEIRAMRGSDG